MEIYSRNEYIYILRIKTVKACCYWLILSQFRGGGENQPPFVFVFNEFHLLVISVLLDLFKNLVSLVFLQLNELTREIKNMLWVRHIDEAFLWKHSFLLKSDKLQCIILQHWQYIESWLIVLWGNWWFPPLAISSRSRSTETWPSK